LARVVVVATDLMLASRVTTSLSSSGHEVEQASTAPDEVDGVDLIVADLDAVDSEQLGQLRVPVLGFHQHTDVETKRRAEDAGIDLVVPRSRMVRELPQLVDRVLADRR
jgi:DNA-binding response OmpR family regulator